MKRIISPIVWLGLVCVLVLSLTASAVDAQDTTPSQVLAPLGTGFTYQGELQDDEGAVTGVCDFQFKLWDAPSLGGQVGNAQAINNVSVSEGLFAVILNDASQFGSSAFTGESRWLELAVRCPAGSGLFTSLTPRQILAASPYALHSQTTSWNGIADVPADFSDGIDNDTTYAAGTCLSLNGTTFSVQSISWTAISGIPAGFSDNVDNDTTYAAGSGLALNNGTFSVQSVPWAALSGTPAGFADNVDNDTTYTAGTGLALNSGAFSVQSVPWTTLSGVPAGFADDIDNATVYTAGTGLALNNGTFSVQSIPWTALSGTPAGFADDVDDDTTYTAGAGLALSSGAFSIQFAGTGSSTSASRADHNHGGQDWVGVGDYGLRIQNDTAATFASGMIGIVTQANNSAGIHGRHESSTGSGRGVFGVSESNSGIGTSGYASSLAGSTTGVFGSVESNNGVGVSGYAASLTGLTTGVLGGSESISGTGVSGIAYATSGANAGIYGKTNSPAGWAAFFDGDVNINGTLYKSAGSFRIDHPLDPENKYLSHSFVESPDMMNVYNGNVTLDGNGEGVVDLPSYFEALNKDFRYQLTAIGGPGPNLYIAETVSNNRFKIAGGTPNLIVSWQVTGVRQDTYALEHPIIVEEEKPDVELGVFSSPQVFDQSAEQGLHYSQQVQNEVSISQAEQQIPAASVESTDVVSSIWENR